MFTFIKNIFSWLEVFYSLFIQYYYILPEFLLANGILFFLCYGIFSFKPASNSMYKFVNSVLIFVIVLLVFTGSMLSKLSTDLRIHQVNNLLFFWDQFTVDYLALVFKFLLLLIFICLLVILRTYLVQQRIYVFEYVFLLLTSILGSFIIISANDFLLLYLAIELQALSFYVLAAFNTKSKFSAEGAIKYFVIGSLASAFYLFGVALIYGVIGTTNFYDLHICIANVLISKPLTIGFIFLLVSLFIKIGAAPFHMWVPDVYQGSPLPVTAFFATIPKIVLVSVFLRLVYYVSSPTIKDREVINPFLSEEYNLSDGTHYVFDGFYTVLASNLFWGVGLLSVLIGVVGGLGQTQLKRLFAYSSIGNIGFIFLALSTNSIDSIHAALVYLIIYILLALNFFLVLIALRYETRMPIVYISDLSMLKPSILHIFLALNLFSLAGIPPLAGFYSKFYVYYLLMVNSNYITTFVVIILTIGSTFYYIRLISALFFNAGSLSSFFTNVHSIKNYFEAPVIKVRLQRDLIFLIGLTSYLNLFAIFHFNTLFNLLNKLVLTFF